MSVTTSTVDYTSSHSQEKKKEMESISTTPSLTPSPSNNNNNTDEIANPTLGWTTEELGLINGVLCGQFALHSLEKRMGVSERTVEIRRYILSRILSNTNNSSSNNAVFKNNDEVKEILDDIPHLAYDYSKVMGRCCENVIGYVPVPLGIAGPLLVDGREVYLPLATSEGCLVASIGRGCKALSTTHHRHITNSNNNNNNNIINHSPPPPPSSVGVRTEIVQEGMSRAPCILFPSIHRAATFKKWSESLLGLSIITKAFNSTSQYAKLKSVKCTMAGRTVYVRFVATTGDAMGMNMLSKGVESALSSIKSLPEFHDMKVVAISGNLCADKKPASVNWIEGRGRSVIAEALIPSSVLKTVLKTTAGDMAEVGMRKCLVGSAMAGAGGGGGFNAHSANVVSALYIALGQDPAQNVVSSNCITLMEKIGDDDSDGGDLYVTCTMPSLEVGTVGGGTVLPAQSASLALLGVRGPHPSEPGENARKLARIVCAAVLAGEVSLCAALASGDLVKSHMSHNRSSASASETRTSGTSRQASSKSTSGMTSKSESAKSESAEGTCINS